MEEIVKYYLDDNKELIEKYKKAEERYLKKLGNKYETIQLDLDFEEEEIRRMFLSLAKAEVCFDDFVVSKFKVYLVEREMEKI